MFLSTVSAIIFLITTMNATYIREPHSQESKLRQRRKRKQDNSPPVLVEHNNEETEAWQGAFVPPPLVSQSTILGAGIVLYLIATIYPALLILVAYVASKLVPYAYRVNDTGSARRELFTTFCKEATLPAAFTQVPEYLQLKESYWVNARGMTLCTTHMIPTHMPVKAVVCFCHGYTDSVSFMKQVEYQRLVKQGIAFVAIEYEGHGRSDGSFGLIPSFDTLVQDVTSFFAQAIREFKGKPAFLMGESMGGAVAFSVYERAPTLFRGVVLVCPMCKIADDMLPAQWVIDALTWLVSNVHWLGYLPIAPAAQSLGDLAHKLPHKRALLDRTPLVYGRNPRLATARELIRVTQRISASLDQFSAPFLVQHGRADRVTDPALSQALYKESKSRDKSIRLYDGLFHGLTSTESDECIDRVFGDAISWILERV